MFFAARMPRLLGRRKDNQFFDADNVEFLHDVLFPLTFLSGGWDFASAILRSQQLGRLF